LSAYLSNPGVSCILAKMLVRSCAPIDAATTPAQARPLRQLFAAEAEAIARIFGMVQPLPDLAPFWNVAQPTQGAAVVRRHPVAGGRHVVYCRTPARRWRSRFSMSRRNVRWP
jgi:hypothetical protein